MTYSSKPLKDLTPEERQRMIERSARRAQEEKGERNRPMRPDHDLTWENTNFEGFEYD